VPNIALYRKYRPRTFAEVIGQEHVTEPLMAALRNDKLNHAYLFSGPRGCGKTSSARILARSVNCAKGPTPEPCGECESCRALAPDGPGSIDVIEIDAASHGGVDDARELREKAFFAPVNSRFKVYVIDEAHMVSSAGFNALLKLVEEPPEYVMFVFATTEPDKVLGTIKSRTHHYPFRLVPPGVMREHLESICAQEGVQVDPAVFPLVVRAGGGSVRDSQSIMDQLLAGADESGVSYPRAVALLGVTDVELIDAAVDALAASDGAALFGAVDRVVEAGHDPRRFASDLLERLRDLIVLNQVPDAAGKGLLAVPPDQLERLTGQALRLGPATLSRMADILHDGLTTMRGATSPRLVLEVLCARMLLPGDEATADLLQRLERLERRVDTGAVASSAPAPPPPAAAPGSPAPAAPGPGAPGSGAPGTAASGAGGSGSSASGPASAGPDGSGSASAGAGASGSASAGSASAEPDSGGSSASGDGAASPGAASVPGAAPAAEAGGTAGSRALAEAPAAPRGTGSPADAAPGDESEIALVSRSWSAIVEHTKRRRVVWSLLQNAAPFAIDGDTLVLKGRNAGIAVRFTDDNVVGVVQDALHAVLHRRWRIRCEANPSAPSRTNQPASPSAPSRPRQPEPPAPADDGGWPEIARPGGSAPSGPVPDGGDRPGGTVGAASPPSGLDGPRPGDAAGPGTPSGAGPGSTGPGTAGGGGPTAPRGAVATAPAPVGVGSDLPVPDGPTDFSPDDPVPASLGGAASTRVPPSVPASRAPAAAPELDGFAPGDEPTDEPFDPAAAPKPVSVEDRAVDLLVQNLGAERLD